MGDMVSYPSNGDTCDAYLALPESGSGPGVIVIQEWWGLVDHVRDVADRFAAEGFVALAPDFYHGAKTGEPDEAQRLLMGMAMDRAAKDIQGSARYLASRPEITGDGVGVVGFCMGGSLALWTGALADEVKVAVGFYPAIPWEKMQPTWGNYSGKAAMIHASEEDGTSKAEGVQQAVRGIESAGGTVEVFDYPGTQHAFFNDQRPEVHDKAASGAAWQRTVDLLKRHL
ncbi:MAG: carboxymethylenebutenolidase [Actinomycetota bacterium]|nr:carboxymethylenebutenolidase [Actinomycetota bacterium]MDQ1641465.1 carboxymethylenebutenolidase [Actinomycetota bacterium]